MVIRTSVLATTAKICINGSSKETYVFFFTANHRATLHIRALRPKKGAIIASDGYASGESYSALHFRDHELRQVSYYTLLSGCILPMPPSCCL